MPRLRLRGYTDTPSYEPGGQVKVHVSANDAGSYRAELVRLFNGDPHPDGPGPREEVVNVASNGEYPARLQRTQNGGYVQVPDPSGRLAPEGSFSVHAFISSMVPARGRQAVISKWDDDTKTGWSLEVDEDGALRFVVGDGSGSTSSVTSNRRLFSDTFYSVSATYDSESGTIALFQKSVVSSTNGVFGKVFPLDSDCAVQAAAAVAPETADVPLIIAGLAESVADDTGRTWVTANFNGKIDSPAILEGVATTETAEVLATGTIPAQLRVIARWDFAAGYTKDGIVDDLIHEVGGAGLNGFTVNTPDRAMTGWNWRGTEEVFKYCPEEYGAIWFHEDSLDDCRWDVDFEVSLPADLASGCYAVRLTQGDSVDWVPFFVRPPAGTATAKILLLIPTISYLAYANSQVMQNAPTAQAIMGHFSTLEEIDLELNENGGYGLSTYDYHIDGRGCQYSSWKRPILNMRPRYTHEFGTVWQYPADLQLVDWLNTMGFEYDVATDHDLQREGVDLFKRYNVVMTGTHPEYYTRQMIDAWETYLAEGGRGMYLAGNGMYWIASPHPQKPWLMEIRKGEQGDQAWRARPGELYHGTSGERGGLWRMRGRSSAKVWGVVYTSHCLDVGYGYEPMPDSYDPKLSWMFDGIEKGAVIGDFGLVNHGAAGVEVDRYDQSAGTPPNAYLVGSSYSESNNWVLVPEENYFAFPGMYAPEHPMVKSDLVYFSTPNGGAMWSASSMSWCGSLQYDGCDNNVSQMTANVLRYFSQDGKLPEI
ncbi:N,N-dimethylformamidase beta subunit family domain-containing protein [Streptomyces brasiliensis]|uniref:Large subunit of N,N-dimethylformamidase n=1 Tax=Streptomyces brasiliensis TaxID=1954 RepID=A0A917PCZ8_9ACTN|nr:N,N-dimethylformamidase beta subunit family domain-containing protein [Streptomyces brasiliensis]GGJ71409.1 large subunit of N,N-dimethylformamidase [Streptomyces brasiliensis]